MLLYDKKFGLNGEKDGAKEEGRKEGQGKMKSRFALVVFKN